MEVLVPESNIRTERYAEETGSAEEQANATMNPQADIALSGAILLATAVVSALLGATIARTIRAHRSPRAKLTRALKARFPRARVRPTHPSQTRESGARIDLTVQTQKRTIRVRAPRLERAAALSEARMQTEIARVLAQAVRAERRQPLSLHTVSTSTAPSQTPPCQTAPSQTAHTVGAGPTSAEPSMDAAAVNPRASREALDAALKAEILDELIPVLLPHERTEPLGPTARFTLSSGPNLDIGFLIPPLDQHAWLTHYDAEVLALDASSLLGDTLSRLLRSEIEVTKESAPTWEVYSVRPSDGAEASRLLLPQLWERVAQHAGAPLVLCAPSVDRLYAAPLDHPESIARMMSYASADWAQRPHELTTTLWTWTEGALEPWNLHA